MKKGCIVVGAIAALTYYATPSSALDKDGVLRGVSKHEIQQPQEADDTAALLDSSEWYGNRYDRRDDRRDFRRDFRRYDRRHDRHGWW